LCAKNKISHRTLRNLFGSEKIMFQFMLLARNNDQLAEEMACELPIAQHREFDYMIISHTTGKKSKTTPPA